MSTTRSTSDSRRAVWLDRLARAAATPSDRQLAWKQIVMRRLCLVLFELPKEVQIGLAVAIAERYLPIFERRHPNLTQLREFLGRCLTSNSATDYDIHVWYADLPQDDRDDNLTGRTLLAAVSLAAEATREGAMPMTVTTACARSVDDAISTAYWETWERIDPEASAVVREDLRRSELDLPDLPYNRLEERNRWHPEVQNTVYAGWKGVVDWLRAADIGQYPDPVDRRTLAKIVRHQKQPIVAWVLYPPHPDQLKAQDEPEEPGP